MEKTGSDYGRYIMEEKIVKEIMKECNNWKERLFVKLFTKVFVNTYKLGVKTGFNWSNKTVH